MKKLMIVIFVSILVCMLSYFPVWAEGWGNTNWGMSISEVETVTNGKVIKIEGSPVYSHKLQDKFSIDKYGFEVMFNFTNNKLDKVLLKNEGDDYYMAYYFLLDELKKKYGNPSDGPKKKRDATSQREEAEWVTNGMVIKLSYNLMILKDLTLKLTSLIYSPRQSASSGKL